MQIEIDNKYMIEHSSYRSYFFLEVTTKIPIVTMEEWEI